MAFIVLTMANYAITMAVEPTDIVSLLRTYPNRGTVQQFTAPISSLPTGGSLNLDGGMADSEYGGMTVIEGGGA